ncbi:MAG: MFS transporter [Gammaproteobacteria bacterium]|nr:MFS transporter [Gammaproteobacteria bacterium]
MAFLTSQIALSIDAILPALEVIGSDLNVADIKDSQLIIISLFLGMSFSQFLFGPISDSIGRKPSIAIGIGIFLIGSLFSIYAEDLTTMLIGRFIQGIGIASPRVVTIAIIRDTYQGSAMARIMSFMMTIFIIIPIIAPTFGYWVMTLSNWRMIFIIIALLSSLILVWFYIRQVETLKAEHQQTLDINTILFNLKIIIKNKKVMAYTTINGLIFGSFLGYLSASQHIFQNIFDTGELFPYYFAALAATFGVSSLLNAKWVIRLGSHLLTQRSLIAIITISSITTIANVLFKMPINLIAGMIYLSFIFFFVGFLFGNLSSLAMEPLGKLAGIGSGVVGSLSLVISIVIGHLIGTSLETSILNLVIGFLLCALASLGIMKIAES